MNYPIVKFGKFAGVPTVCCAYEISGDSLDCLEFYSTFWTDSLVLVCILVAAFRTMVAVMVHRSIADVIFIHHVYYLHYGFLIVGGIPVDFHIENMSSACKVMIGCLNLCLMAR